MSDAVFIIFHEESIQPQAPPTVKAEQLWGLIVIDPPCDHIGVQP